MATRMAWNVRWADGRALVSYPTEGMAKEAAKRLGDGVVSQGTMYGRMRHELPPVRKSNPAPVVQKSNPAPILLYLAGLGALVAFGVWEASRNKREVTPVTIEPTLANPGLATTGGEVGGSSGFLFVQSGRAALTS